MKRTITMHQRFMLAMTLLLAVGLNSLATAAPPKPRVLVLTDISTWETDDHESLIRFLAHADLFEIEGIVISTGYSVRTLKKSPENGFINIARGVVDAYEQDLPNLMKRSNQTGHAFDDATQEINYWPSAKYLRDRVLLGSLDRGKKFIGDDNGSPGSDLIIKLADEDDSRPLWVTIWGGGNTLAQSIYQVKKDRSPAEVKSFLQKLRAYAITDQDRNYRGEALEVSSHGWIYEQTGNDLRFIWDESAWKAHNGVGKRNWDQYEKHIQSHGNMGSQYPKYKFGVEGDTPAFLYLLPNGLNNPEDPTQASWGGNFKEDKNNLWREAKSCESNFKRFYPAAFNSFAARMDWAKDGTGNRNPNLVLDGDSGIDVLTKTPDPGTAVTLDASKTTDPDGDDLKFNWWVQDDAGSYAGDIKISDKSASKVSIEVPSDAAGKSFHVICEARDNGTHNLSSYRRVVFKPTGKTVAASALKQNADVKPIAEFNSHTDIGPVKHEGNAAYDAAKQTYEISGSGANMWFGKDEFHFVWKKMKGDFILSTQAELIGKGVDPHRKLGLMIRPGLTHDAPYVDVALHGDGLTSMQFRRAKGADTEQVESGITMPNLLQLERRDGKFYMSVAKRGDTFTTKALEGVTLPDDVYVGLFVCSHNADVVERATFSNVRVTVPAPKGFKPYRDYIGSRLEVMDVESGHRRVLRSDPGTFEAPNWTRDGKALIFNEGGKLYRFDLATNKPTLIDSDFAQKNNNDHVISFDGKMLGISHHSADHDGRSMVFTMPITGGKPKLITAKAPSYFHGWSSDDKWLTYTGGRNDNYDIYKIRSDGSGEEVRLTTSESLDDGPEFSPDGKHIYFNSARSGKMQIWRMKPDGSDQEQVTDDEYNNWFPHLSPDGKRMVMLSYGPEIAATDHPWYKHVYLRVLSTEDGENAPKVIATVYGGQGTINVPSWSPDGKQIAFVSNSKQ